METKQEYKILASDFTFVQKDKEIKEVKFQSKRTTYLKDIFKRFVKNKASVVGFIIIGFILLMSIILPVSLPGHVNGTYTSEQYLPPKLFNAGTGFWDGTLQYKDIPYNKETNKVEFSSSSSLVEEGITGQIETYENKVNYIAKLARGGEITLKKEKYLFTDDLEYTFTNTYNVTSKFSTNEFEFILTLSPKDSSGSYLNDAGESEEGKTSLEISLGNNNNFEINSILKEKLNPNLVSKLNTYTASLKLLATNDNVLSNFKIETNANNASEFAKLTLNDKNAEELYNITLKEDGTDKVSLWNRSDKSVVPYQATMTFASFTYDPYIAIYGVRKLSLSNSNAISALQLQNLAKEGAISFEITDDSNTSYQLNDDGTINAPRTTKNLKIKITELDSSKNYIIVDDNEHPYSIFTTYRNGLGWVFSLECYAYNYKILGYSSMPIHLFGTDVNGYDMLKLVAQGTLYSLGLGIFISIICMAFGLVWGSISGYFGGTVDIIMERIVDILSYIPLMVVITLFMLNWGRSIGIFILAMCLTGWIGTAAVTRTQFYRFKGHEYVLASRTLGASDARLISKHILPNGLGTIITSSVLMIPSVIYSEASLSFLGLGFTDIYSLGRIIQSNQSSISTISNLNPTTYLIIFPTVILALLLISFEMFGQGLRDSVNPNLKGSD